MLEVLNKHLAVNDKRQIKNLLVSVKEFLVLITKVLTNIYKFSNDNNKTYQQR